MVELNRFLRRSRRILARPANIPAAIALIVMVMGGFFAEQQNRYVYRQDVEAEVLSEVSLIRSRLEGAISANIQLARGLVATIATEPKMDQARFAELAENLFAADTQLKHIAAAPGLVVEMIYPVRGNERALGLDYRQNAAQRAAALRARDKGSLVLAGPVDLVQGGTGFIGRFPVFVDQPSGRRAFWGIVSAVVDADALYLASGLHHGRHGLDIAITGRDGLGAGGELFFGDPDVLANDPVTVTVQLPDGSWQIAATPHGGWPLHPPNLWAIRGMTALAILLVVVPIMGAGWLVGERHDTLRRLRLNQRELERVSRRLELALTASEIGVWENYLPTGALYWDRRMRQLYDTDPDVPLSYEDWEKRLHPDDRDMAVNTFRAAVEKRTPYASVFRVLHRDGSVRTIRAMGSVHDDADGHPRITGVNWDISRDVALNEELREAKQQSEARNEELELAKASIEYNALHDSLTGLPNRRYLDELLNGQSTLKLPPDGDHSLLHIDLDRFKQINDTLGHAAGDAVLMHVASVLRDNVRDTDFVARIGGDEFVIICMSRCDTETLRELAGRLVEKMHAPVRFEGRECRIGVSIGIAHGNAGARPQQMLVNADIALYKAKESGRNGYQFFSEDLHQAAVNTKQLADEILTAIEQKQFVAHYQGQFDAQTYEITGVEALARWQHPERGLLTPDAFLDVAEEINVVSRIDAIILEQAVTQLNRWRRSGLEVPRVSVNVSARRLHDEKLIDSLSDLSFEPGTLTFELVESTFLDNREDIVSWNIDQFREMGIDVEIDDFGTGYASIVSLMQLRPDRLKIDRQLVMPVDSSRTQRDLVGSIVQIGASLGIDTVAEGVETIRHAEILRDLGCQTLQGYAFAQPMSARAFSAFARKRAWGVSAA